MEMKKLSQQPRQTSNLHQKNNNEKNNDIYIKESTFTSKLDHFDNSLQQKNVRNKCITL